MLAETVTQWTQQWLEKGRQKGILQEGEQKGQLPGLQKAAVVLAQRDLLVAEIAQALELEKLETKRMLA